jgi:hypothetical protein
MDIRSLNNTSSSDSPCCLPPIDYQTRQLLILITPHINIRLVDKLIYEISVVESIPLSLSIPPIPLICQAYPRRLTLRLIESRHVHQLKQKTLLMRP